MGLEPATAAGRGRLVEEDLRGDVMNRTNEASKNSNRAFKHVNINIHR